MFAKHKPTGKVFEVLRVRNGGTIVLTTGDRINPTEFKLNWEIVEKA